MFSPCPANNRISEPGNAPASPPLSARSPRSSALVSPRASKEAKEMKDPKENEGSEGVLEGIKKPKDGSGGGSGGKMMGQMAPKGRPEILQAGRGIRRGEEGQY